MKRSILAILTLSFIAATSCSSKRKSSEPQVKTEIYGISSDDNSKSENDTDSSQTKENIALNYAVYGEIPTEEYELIKQFNQADNGYIIVVKDYSVIAGADENGDVVYDHDTMQAFRIKLMQDISNGEIDIIRDLYLGAPQNMNRLSENDAFIDLYSMMQNDPDVNPQTLNSHILQLHETNGKLYTLPTYYTFETLIGRTKYVGDKENWTLDELISHWKQMPAGSMIQGSTDKYKVYSVILRGMLGTFIDYKNASVSFDSPEFRNALEFCNTFDDISDTYIEPDSSAVDFVSDKRFYGFANTHFALWNTENEPYTFVGYPTENGCGGFIDTRGNRFAICASTTEEERQGAWEFIRTYCLDEYQTKHYCKVEKMLIDGEAKDVFQEPVGFPMNLKIYDQLAKDAMAGKHMDSTIGISGSQHEIGLLTQDELERLTCYVNNIQALTVNVDDDLNKIINDEVISYFNGGNSIDDCIRNIQSRAEVMVSEKQ